MIRKFVDRKRELEILEELYNRGANLIVVYGRRRVGKTTLLRKFLKDKRGIYFLCSQRGYEKDLERFSEAVSEFLGMPVKFDSFEDAFRFLAKHGKLVVVIDEFPYLIEAYRPIVSVFQEIVDLIIKDSQVTLILSGSSVGMMERKVLSYKAPLYGRARGIMKLKPFRFFDMMEWYGRDFEKLVRLYGVTWGVPRYMELLNDGSDKEIIANFFEPTAFLFNEARLLLMEELRNPTTYAQIIEAIALGKTRLTEIAQYAMMEAKDLPAYLRVLQELGIVKREVPVTKKVSKRGIYTIEDEYFRFYYRFVSPHYEDIEGLNPEPAIEDFRKNFNTYLGTTFEKVAKEFLIMLSGKGYLPSRYHRFGRWWHKGEEIDLIALNERERKALFVEVKWKELSEREARGILRDLKRKAELVGLDSWEHYYGIVAKDVGGKEGLREEGFLVFDLGDFPHYR
ncbi:ATPase [Thermococcus siculi]|uniref:ATPase n=1 Tax=Thermococcus siculi TaxID=72803 RepID=A0A2Z2MJJ8_9EURY|nr:ATP-binding protein [Thermococcus siculi]ASJ08579.1 ATPase [Thermococcus siculi]